jgi:ABC-type sugar transport system ATPase subunit
MNTGNGNKDSPVCVAVRGLWKIFGNKPAEIIKSKLKNATRREIREKTGNILAIRDASFEVHEGEIFVIMGSALIHANTLFAAYRTHRRSVVIHGKTSADSAGRLGNCAATD